MLPVISGLIANVYLWMWSIGIIFLFLSTRENYRVRKWGVILFIGIWLFGTRPVAEGLLSPLENCYDVSSIETLKKEGVHQVVVLTGGGFPLKRALLSSAFPHASLYRFIGGLELCTKLGPDCHIVFSGSAGRQNQGLRTAEIMKNLSLTFEPERNVSAEALSASTSDHPLNIKHFVGNKPFALVTSACHMTRSVRAFRKAGMNPVPYPVDFLVQGNYQWMDWVPSAESLWKLQVGLREYFALLFYTLRG